MVNLKDAIIDADKENQTDTILERAIEGAKKKAKKLTNDDIIIGSRKKKGKRVKAKRKSCGCK